MDAFETGELVAAQDRPGEHTYVDFFRKEMLSLGMSVWPAGGEDTQQPHTEDEVYIVMAGRGTIRVADEGRPVRPGSVVYVGAGVDHRFHSVDEDLHVLVFWAPPYGSRAEPGAAPGEAAAHRRPWPSPSSPSPPSAGASSPCTRASAPSPTRPARSPTGWPSATTCSRATRSR